MPTIECRQGRWAALALILACLPTVVRGQTGRILERGPHHAVHQAATGRWIQLETGLHYWDTVTRSWQPAREEILPMETGAVAFRGQHQVVFSSNVNDPDGAVNVRIDQQTRLRSSVLALRYFDPASGGEVLLATVKDAPGELLPPNQVIYRDAFDRVNADLVYTYRKHGLEADVVLREVIPSPAEFGLAPEVTRLEVVTEFFEAPVPEKRPRLLASTADARLRARVAEPDWVDEELVFGPHRLADGRAFAWSAREAARSRPEEFPAVGKRWVTAPDGRTLLIESVEYQGLLDELLALPGAPGRKAELEERARQWAGRPAGALREEAFSRVAEEGGSPVLATLRRNEWALAPSRPAVLPGLEDGPLQWASISPAAAPGLVIDWATLGSTLEDFTFAATNTYLVTGETWLSGTTVIEGGTVVKFRPYSPVGYSGLNVLGTVDCRTSAYRPAFFTADADDSVGESVAAGPPAAGTDYAWMALKIHVGTTPPDLRHLRIRHAYHGLYLLGGSATATLSHVQFLNCRYPVVSTAASLVRLRNVLMDGGREPGAALLGAGTSFVGEQVTFHNLPSLAVGGSVVLTNSLVIDVDAVAPFGGAGNFQAPTADGVFQTVGAGRFYLPTGSPHRNAGVPLSDPTFAATLRELTTVAPRVLSSTITDHTQLGQVVDRDFDTPDRGYHYEPLDHAVGGVTVAQSALRLVGGVVLGAYGANGLNLGDGARLESVGTPAAPNRLVRFSAVQEQAVSAWNSTAADLSLIRISEAAPVVAPVVQLESTDVFAVGGTPQQRAWLNPGAGPVAVQASQARFYGTALTFDGTVAGRSLAITNGLIEQGTWKIEELTGGGNAAVGLSLYHTLFRNGSTILRSTRPDSTWVVRDNLFANYILEAQVPAGGASHNAFGTGLTTFGSSALAGRRLFFAESPLDPYLYPIAGDSVSLASLYDAGSRTASAAGLTGFTTRVDGTPEGSTTVDVGRHVRSPAPVMPWLAGAWRMDEGAGMLVRDSSTNANHGSFVGDPEWVWAQQNRGLSFDGVRDAVSVPDAPSLQLGTSFTVAFWIKKEVENAGWVQWIGKGLRSRNFGIWDVPGASGQVFFQFIETGGQVRQIASAASLQLGRWHHVACVLDAGVGRIYIDGALQAQGAMAGTPQTSSEPLTFAQPGGGPFFQGCLDEIFIYRAALSAGEVQALQDAGRPAAEDQGLVGDWRLDEALGVQALDRSRQGNHGRLQGADWGAGKQGAGVEFDAVADHVRVGDAPGLRLTRAFTMMFWIRKNTEHPDWIRIFGKGAGAQRNYAVWDWPGSDGRLLFQFWDLAGAAQQVTSRQALGLNQWYHVACTWDGAVGRIYLDGQLDSSAPMTGVPRTSADALTFGSAGSGGFLHGAMDEVRLYDRSLSAEEVATQMRNTLPAHVPTFPLAWWPLDDGAGTKVEDLGGRLFHGQRLNGVQSVAGPDLQAMSFDGVDDQIVIPDSPELRLTNAFSVAFWARRDGDPADWVRLVGKGAGSKRNFGVWKYPGASGRLLFQFIDATGQTRQIISQRELATGQWHHVACVWNGTTGAFYLDGTLDRSGPMPGVPGTSADPVTFGWAGYGARFVGGLDDVRLYTRALSAGEVSDLMDSAGVDPDLDGRTDAQEGAEDTDAGDGTSVKPLRLLTLDFDHLSTPWISSSGQGPAEQAGVTLIETTVNTKAVEVNGASSVLRYPHLSPNGAALLNPRQGTLQVTFYPYWASADPDCGTAIGTGPGTNVHLVSLGDLSLMIDARGTNLMLVSPNGSGGLRTNVQARIRACVDEYALDFPIEVQASYSPLASALFINRVEVGRGNGVVGIPGSTDRSAGLFIGSNARRGGQVKGLIEQVITYNVPLNLWTNAAALTAVVNPGADPTVSLTWQGPTDCRFLVERREVPGGDWNPIQRVQALSFVDPFPPTGTLLEYRVSVDVGVPEEFEPYTSPNYTTAFVGIDLPPAADDPGRVLLVVDRTLLGNADFAEAVLGLERDLWRDGWKVSRYDGPRHDDVTWANNWARISEVRTWILGQRAVDPSTRAVLLLGHLPIPFSGMLSPDGHLFRPLPADSYYVDVDGQWTDTQNWPAGLGIETPNVPGDGYLDQELVPAGVDGVAAVEMSVGRVDMANLTSFASASPPVSEAELLVRYIEKARKFRRAQTTFPARTLYGAYFTTNPAEEAAAQQGAGIKGLVPYLTRQARRWDLTLSGSGPSVAVRDDFFAADMPAILGVLGGFGGGVHFIHSSAPVNAFHGLTPHGTADLVVPANEPPVAFTLVESSFNNEWHRPEHLGRAQLATTEGGYGWFASGTERTEWQFPVLALGRTSGEAWLRSMNDSWQWAYTSVIRGSPYGSGNRIYFHSRSQGGYAFLTHLGDPTLRQSPTAPPGGGGQTLLGSGQLQLNWTASPAPGATYHVYRALGGVGSAWQRLTSSPLAGTTFVDPSPSAPPRRYLIRAATVSTLAAGSYTNLSAGLLIE